MFNKDYFFSFVTKVLYLFIMNRIVGVIVSVLTSGALDHVFVPCTGQTKDYKISNSVLLLR